MFHLVIRKLFQVYVGKGPNTTNGEGALNSDHKTRNNKSHWHKKKCCVCKGIELVTQGVGGVDGGDVFITV
jgi:hypothetical protein